MAVTRLSGGLTPANGSDPRTFPAIWNATADDIEQAETDIAAAEANITALQSGLAASIIFIETEAKTADYTLALADASKVVSMNKTGAATLTIPLNSSVLFPVGTIIGVYNQSSNDVTVSGAVGVTVRNAGTVGQYAEASLRKRGTDEWVMVGG